MVHLGQSVEEGVYSFLTKNGGFCAKVKVTREKEKEKSQRMAGKQKTNERRVGDMA